ncbi:sterol carrier family protein, partial [Kineococcus gypseus]|uniref:sterol carrier family protein n=1 Tax=Kineococcus gypseus TaxID=1637102 RepID=UPI003D7D17A3
AARWHGGAVPPRRRTDPEQGRAALREALAAVDAGGQPARPALAAAVRFTLEELAARHPGGSVEVRVPPFAAVQVVQGPRHTRGTPPAVVETDPVTWLQLATGRLAFDDARAGGRVRASGERADLGALLPLPAAGG